MDNLLDISLTLCLSLLGGVNTPKSEKKKAKKKTVKKEEIKEVSTPKEPDVYAEKLEAQPDNYSWLAMSRAKPEETESSEVAIDPFADLGSDSALDLLKQDQEKREEAELKVIEDAMKKSQKAAKRRNLKPVTIKITGENLIHWYAMLDGIRSSLLTRNGVSAAEKAVYSELPISNDTALVYLLMLHDEEMERHTRTVAPHQEDIERIEKQMGEKARAYQARRPAPITSSNPHSILAEKGPAMPAPNPLGAMTIDSGFTMGGAQMSEADFFRMAQTKKVPRPVKKGM